MRGPQAQVIVVRAEPYGAASAYRVFRDPVRGLLGLERDTPEAMGQALLATLGQVAPDLLPMAPLLADVVQVDVPSTPEVDQLDPQYRPDRLADAVVRLVDAMMPGPLVLVAEEAHWADGASARLLDRIAAASSGRPWAVIAVRRGEEGGFAPAAGTHVTLEPLPAEVMERLVIAATEATPLRPHEIAAVVDRAQGNPLFVEEVTRVALSTGSLDTLPESVQAAMSAQIDLLHPDARRVLRYCAVLGRSFRVEVLRRTMATDGLVADASTLSSLRAFLQPDGPDRWKFRNSLVRDAAYEGLAYKIRSRLHRAAGETLEAMSTDLDADSPTLALHFWRAGDAERTWQYAQKAGELARHAYSNVDAAELYERALEVSRRVPGVSDADRAALWSVLGDLRELSGMLDESVEALRRASSMAPDPVSRAEALARMARVRERAGAMRSSLRIVGQARKVLSGVPEESALDTQIRLDQLMAVIRLGQEKPAEARRWAAQAANAARAAGNADVLANALMLQDFADSVLGSPGVGEATREALQVCIDNGYRPREAIARENLGSFAFLAGRWVEAVEWYTASRRVALEAGNAYGAAKTDVNLADILIRRGALDEADELLQNAVRVLRVSGLESESIYGELMRARVLLARGEFDAAEGLARQVASAFRALELPASVLEANVVAAQAAVDLGRADEALEILDAESSALVHAPWLTPEVSLVRSRALVHLGRIDEAAEVIETGLSAAQDQELAHEEALLRLTRVGLGSPDESSGEEDLAEARRILDALGLAAPSPR